MSCRISREAALSSAIRTRRCRSSFCGTLRDNCPLSPASIATLKVKVLPTPGRLSTPMLPPISSTSCLLMARPSPVPPNRRVVELSACEKEWNSNVCCSGVMPMPVSRILTSSVTPGRVACTCAASAPGWSKVRMETVTLPLSVNLMALVTRFSSTWFSRSASPSNVAGTAASISRRTAIPFSAALTAAMLNGVSSEVRRLKWVRSNESFPASILEKSRMSLIKLRRESPAPLILET